jgi:hypothetical protein
LTKLVFVIIYILKRVQDDIANCHAELVWASISASNIISTSYIKLNFMNYSGWISDLLFSNIFYIITGYQSFIPQFTQALKKL